MEHKGCVWMSRTEVYPEARNKEEKGESNESDVPGVKERVHRHHHHSQEFRPRKDSRNAPDCLALG